MSDCAELRSAIGALLENQNCFSTAASDNEDGWRKEFVARRRQTQVMIAGVVALATRCAELQGRPDHAVQFAAALVQMRSTLAAHQADRPVVAIDNRDRRYRSLAVQVREANRSFGTVSTRILRDIAQNPRAKG